MTVLPRGPSRGKIYTQQSLGCGQSGDQIFLTYEALTQRDTTLGNKQYQLPFEHFLINVYIL